MGDIEDEHDDDAAIIEQVSDNIFIADARTEIDDIAVWLGKLKDAVEEMDVVTLEGSSHNHSGAFQRAAKL